MKKLKPDDKKTVIGKEDEKRSYICSWCSCTLSKLIDSSSQNPSLYCSRCQMSFDPEYDSLRKESKITVPDRAAEPCITSIQTNMANEVEIRHTVPIRGGFAELQKKGLRIKDYRTTERE
jgi:hypothetical protein